MLRSIHSPKPKATANTTTGNGQILPTATPQHATDAPSKTPLPPQPGVPRVKYPPQQGSFDEIMRIDTPIIKHGNSYLQAQYIPGLVAGN
jgi:hypothetical protein